MGRLRNAVLAACVLSLAQTASAQPESDDAPQPGDEPKTEPKPPKPAEPDEKPAGDPEQPSGEDAPDGGEAKPDGDAKPGEQNPDGDAKPGEPKPDGEAKPGDGDEPPPDLTPEPPPKPVDPKLEKAKELHKKGLKLLEAGDVERALAFFRQSRDVVPSAPNITNIAICLQRLGRYDEALETYELLLTEYADGLDAEDRGAIAPTMKELRGKVGSVFVSANVPGTVVIDGRERGELPLSQPIRVLGGKRVVRVLAPGYLTFETTVDVAVKETLKVDAKLERLANVGLVRVEASTELAAVVVIDGSEVGTVPWEGPVAVGKHVVQVVAGDRGSALHELTVNDGQIALARPELLPLGPDQRVTVEPRTATITIDGIALGNGTWIGRLPLGDHTITASERGYHTATRDIKSRPIVTPQDLALKLKIDSEHPRWPKPEESGDFWMDAYAGYAGSPSLGGDASSLCPDACNGSVAAHGGLAGLRAGYRFPIRLSLELGAGYALFGSFFTRDVPSSFGASGQYPITYRIDDSVVVRGPYVAPSVSYRQPLLDWLSLEGRATLGVMFAAVSDDYDAQAVAGQTTSGTIVAQRDLARTVTIFVAPEVGAVAEAGPIDIGLSLAVPIFPLEGPALDNGPIAPNTDPDDENPGAAGNAPVSTLTSGERAWDTFVMFSPQLSAGYTF
jgi:hypothetical protein